MTEQTFHLVRHEHAQDWLRLGWITRPGLAGTHHGEWSVLMQWLCACPMVKPRRDA